MSADYTATEVALDDKLWRLYIRGYEEGMRLGYGDGYAAGVRDEAAAYAAEWAAHRERMQPYARDHGLRERRGGNPNAVRDERERRGWTP